MREFNIVPDENKRPSTKIMVSGFEVITLDINGGWEITKVIFDDEVPAPDIDELIITIKKRQKCLNESLS